LAHAAIDAGRSMNAEILTRLDKSFEQAPGAQLADAIGSLTTLGDKDKAKVLNLLVEALSIMAESHAKAVKK
jgi:hypothetical protein